MHAANAPEPEDPEPRWLAGDEVNAWIRLIGVIIRLPAALDAQLQRDAGFNHFEYTVMLNLSTAPDQALRMSHLAAMCHSSLSRLARHLPLGATRVGAARPCPDDGRATVATLTDEGFAALDAAAPGHIEAVRAFVIDALDAGQLRELTMIGDTILRRLDGDSDDPAAHNQGS